MLKKLQSRKFLLALLASVGYALLAYSNELSWQDATSKIEFLLMAYLGIQGYVESKKG